MRAANAQAFLGISADLHGPSLHACVISTEISCICPYDLQILRLWYVNCIIFAGIGVDDAFVVLETWKRMDKEHPDMPIEEKMAITMKHAGVSVTVTSISDFAAFAAGISTVFYYCALVMLYMLLVYRDFLC